jgi:hypothetical protein
MGCLNDDGRCIDDDDIQHRVPPTTSQHPPETAAAALVDREVCRRVRNVNCRIMILCKFRCRYRNGKPGRSTKREKQRNGNVRKTVPADGFAQFSSFNTNKKYNDQTAVRIAFQPRNNQLACSYRLMPTVLAKQL